LSNALIRMADSSEANPASTVASGFSASKCIRHNGAEVCICVELQISARSDLLTAFFDPSYDVEGIRQKIPTAAHRALRGDLTRATLDALRDAPGPMTTKELARHVMAERGLNTADTALLQLFTRRTGALLRWQRERGILRAIKDPKHGRSNLWEIAV
jgi:hypothetical protein